MRLDDLRLLFGFNYWANGKLLAQAAKLSTEALFEGRGYDWDSLGGTLIHIMDAEYGWRLLLQSEKSPLMTVDDFADMAAIKERWQQEEAAMWAYLNTLTDEMLNGAITYDVDGEPRARVRWHCLVHVVNHGTQHRAECAHMLTQLGHSPGELDLVLYTLEAGL